VRVVATDVAVVVVVAVSAATVVVVVFLTIVVVAVVVRSSVEVTDDAVSKHSAQPAQNQLLQA
jgi:hypothetical protein